MVWLVLASILVVISVALFGVSYKLPTKQDARRDELPRGTARIVSLVIVVIAALVLIPSLFFTQDVGEAKVVKNFGGAIASQSTTAGVHGKAPWQSVSTFDIRNNVISYVGEGKANNEGGSANGPQITFQDRDGVTGNLDVVVRYSVNPESVTDIYREFGTQEAFVNRVITNDIRSVARNIPATYGTLELFNSRAKVGTEIRTALEERWADSGVIVEEVSLQEIRYSADVAARFDEAQASRIAVDKANADQEAAKVVADTKVIEAQGVADANAVLTKSLTPEVLQQKYIDALGAGTVFVVPDGSQPLVTTGK